MTLQREQLSPDGGGGGDLAWSNIATVSGSIKPLTSYVQLRGMQLEAKVSHRITIRHRAGITAKDRVAFDGRVFNIRAAIDPDERKHFLDLLVEEGVAT